MALCPARMATALGLLAALGLAPAPAAAEVPAAPSAAPSAATETAPAPAAAAQPAPKRVAKPVRTKPVETKPAQADATTTGSIAPAGEGAAAAPARPKKPRNPSAVAALAPAPAPIPFQPSRGISGWYAERGGLAVPRGDRLVYCHGFECELRTTVALGPQDLAELTAIFATRRGSPAEERDAIDHAVQWWEKRAAPLLGGPPDIRGSEPPQAHKRGQTDCLDEATNSTTILIWLQQKGLLRYHHVARPDSRGGFLYAHATAVFTEIGGEDWVVDSWMRDSGDPNDVMPLKEWAAKY